MNEQAQLLLQQILQKDPSMLNSDEVAFLRARRDYLNSEQRRVFASVLGEDSFRVQNDGASAPAQPEQVQQPVAQPEQPVQQYEQVDQPQPQQAQYQEVAPVQDQHSADPDWNPQAQQ